MEGSGHGGNSVEMYPSTYKLGKTLDILSFGKVKIAEHTLTGHKVAMKILNRRKIKNMEMEEKVRREIQILRRLFMHPHIIRLYDVVETPSDIFVVMEYAKSGKLSDYIVEKGRLHEDEARNFFQQIISVVEYCHRNMVVHRELNLEYLLLDAKCNVKLADFGLSNIMHDGHLLETSCGTPDYAAPEVISGKVYAGPEADVWSCGVILYALLCGTLVFDDENNPNLFKKIMGGINTLPSHLSPGARDLIPRLLEVDPMKRMTVPEIRMHPWFQKHLPRYLAVPPLDSLQQVIKTDEDILTEVMKMGFDKDSLIESLRNRVQNQGTVAYYLLLDNRFHNLNSYLTAEFQKPVDRSKEWHHLKIPFEEIEVATANFKTRIGRGGYGQVYQGVLSANGKSTKVAVKRLNEQFGQGLKEFLTEIQLLSGQVHPNLISLVGYCDEGKEKIIVYEYAEHGSLDKYIRRINRTDYTLSWLQRLKICTDAARGLDYLHNHVGGHRTVIHRDIKSSNILIDENWVAKISDLGLSKLNVTGFGMSLIVSNGCGTHGYCEPEYFTTGFLTKKSDVYSFGIVLFEVLCGRLCIIECDDDGFSLSSKSVKEHYEKGNLAKIIDPNLNEHMGSYSMTKFSEIAYRCLNEDREQRPAMDVVKQELEEVLRFQIHSISGYDWTHKDTTLEYGSGVSEYESLLDLFNVSTPK